VSRNIQIVPGPDADWGYSVIVYGYKDSDNVTRNGSAQLVGVQFLNGGQLDTVNSPLVFYNDKNNVSKSLVSSSSFMNCKAKCIYINTARNITLDRNVLYKAWISGI
jgi:lactate dehydrogenase-like 2-hydroxyacid dehydrogenase